MSYTLSRNLRLRLDDNLTANARYNLGKLDLLGATILVDTESTLQVRALTDIVLESESADLGGTGLGGTISLGTENHELDLIRLSASSITMSSPLSLLDQATGGTRYLLLQYKSDASGSTDTSANRTLSVDLQGADRSLILGGNLTTAGGAISLTTPSSSTLTLPVTGTLATLLGTETFQNKTISGDDNTITNLRNASVASNAAISYSKLNLTAGIVNADVSPSAAIHWSKLDLTSGIEDSDLSPSFEISRDLVGVGTPSHVVINGTDGRLSSEAQLSISRGGTGAASASDAITALLPSQSGSAGKVLQTDGTTATWETVAGTGTVTSVAMTVPAEFSVAGSPVTIDGTLAVTTTTQSANTIWAGPTTGIAAQPTFRALTVADLPTTTPSRALVSAPDGSTTVSATTSTEIGYVSGVTSALQTQIDGKQPLDVDLTSLAALSTTGFISRTGTATYSPRTITAGVTSGISLTNGDGISGNPTFTVDPTLATAATASTADIILFADVSNSNALRKGTIREALDSSIYSTTWVTGDGASKVVTHNLGSTSVTPTLYDIDSGEEIFPDTFVRTNTNVLTLTASVAPSGSGWGVTVRR